MWLSGWASTDLGVSAELLRRWTSKARRADRHRVVAVNDLTDNKTLAHLLRYDSSSDAYRTTYRSTARTRRRRPADQRVVDGRQAYGGAVGDLGVDVVVGSTVVYRREQARGHLRRGAKKVVVSATSKGADLTVVMGVDHREYEARRPSSPTPRVRRTVAPMAIVLDEVFGIERGVMTSPRLHGTRTCRTVRTTTSPGPRRGDQVVPISTGLPAPMSVVLPQLEGRLDGYALRVPVPTGSATDLTVVVREPATTRRSTPRSRRPPTVS